MRDFGSAPIDEAFKALLRYAVKLTVSPGKMSKEDVEELRRHGFSDRAITDAAQVAGFFNYINRIAEGLGVEPEAFLQE